MASGDLLFELWPTSRVGPSSSSAALDIVSDASTPGLDIPVLDYDGAADEHSDWIEEVPEVYDGGGFTFSYKYAMDGTDGDAVELEFRSLDVPDTTVLTGDLGLDTQTAAVLADDPSATADDFNYSGTVNLSHANAGSPAKGAYQAFRVTRDFDHAANADDLQLAVVRVTET